MILLVVLLIFVVLYKVEVQFGKGFYRDYASIEQTRSINGVFVVLILLSHTFAKVSEMDVFDAMYIPVRTFLGQFVVVPFLFYSGYGIMNSLKHKKDYLRRFLRDRFLPLLIRFAIITLIYIFLHRILGSNYSTRHILLSFIGITSIGNGGWYIFSTFVFYISVIVCFSVFEKNVWIATVAVTLCLVLLIFAEIWTGLPSYYYSTTIFFAVGMVYSHVKRYFDKVVMKNNTVWCIITLASIVGFVFAKRLLTISDLFYPIWCGFGMLMVLCLSMKIKIQNKALNWLGKTVFFSFTLQGIPQIVFARFLNENYVIYFLTILSTFLLTALAEVVYAKGKQMCITK